MCWAFFFVSVTSLALIAVTPASHPAEEIADFFVVDFFFGDALAFVAFDVRVFLAFAISNLSRA
jgi:hypothetical protein